MRILIRYGAVIRKFMVLDVGSRDGSLSLTIRRSGVSTSRTTWHGGLEEQELQVTEFDKPRPKNKRITIHQSGRVNYHEHGTSIFLAPLTQTTQPFVIYRYRIPRLDQLDLHGGDIAEEDAVFDLSDLNEGPVSFSVLLCPLDFTLPLLSIKLGFEAFGYSLVVIVDPVMLCVHESLNNHFTTVVPKEGLFTQQQMAEEQAIISYHQALTESSDLVLYEPNGDGVIKCIFSVPMRIAPRFKIELVDPDLHVSDQDVERDGRSEKVMLKFKVRHRETRKIIKEAVAIRSIELDAEL